MKIQVQELIQVLRQAPRDLQIEVAPAVMRKLKAKPAKRNPVYLSPEEEDAYDLAILRKQTRKDRYPLHSLEDVKRELGIK